MLYDFIVIGGGVSGLGASVYAARFNMKTLVIAGRLGGLIQDTHIVENYPGFKSISGLGLVKEFKKHVEDYSLIVVKEEFAKDMVRENGNFSVTTDAASYQGKTILFATGTKRKKLEVPGAKEYENRGLSFCATCDAVLFKNEVVGVVGGSDSAAKEALLLAEHAKKVYIIYRGDKIHPEPINMQRVEQLIKKGKIEIITKTNVMKVQGNKLLTGVEFDQPYNGKKQFPLGGLFIEIGHIVESELAKKIGVKVDDHGQIMIDKDSKTNVPGVFAAGDVTDREFKQAITGVSEGTVAANSAYEFIARQKVHPK